MGNYVILIRMTLFCSSKKIFYGSIGPIGSLLLFRVCVSVQFILYLIMLIEPELMNHLFRWCEIFLLSVYTMMSGCPCFTGLLVKLSSSSLQGFELWTDKQLGSSVSNRTVHRFLSMSPCKIQILMS